MAVIIHCLETNQDYSVITNRQSPMCEEIEKHLVSQGVHALRTRKRITTAEHGVGQQTVAPSWLLGACNKSCIALILPEPTLCFGRCKELGVSTLV